MSKVKNYTDEELIYFEKKADELILWLFNGNDKRFAIKTILKDVYEKALEKGSKNDNN